MKINDFHEIRDFRDGAQLRHSCRVVKSAFFAFSHKNLFFFVRNKNMTHIVSDVVAGVGAPWDHSKSSKSMIFRLLQKKTQVFLWKLFLKKIQTYMIYMARGDLYFEAIDAFVHSGHFLEPQECPGLCFGVTE